MRRPLPPLSRIVVTCTVLVVGAILAAGCGEDDAPRSTTTTATTPTTATSTTATEPSATTPTPPPATPANVNAAAAVATGRRLDSLARAYAPVSARLNFLVTAEVLWRDALENEAPTSALRDRAGAVRIELLRMQPLLLRAQRALKAQVQSQPEVRAVQTLLLQAINHRTLALQRLDAYLDASSDPDMDDDAVEELDDLYRISHDAAARAAREATDEVQELRASLGLEPASEEAFR